MGTDVHKFYGLELKAIRGRLGLSVRQVESASRAIARKLNDRRYFVSVSRLSELENRGLIPGVYKLFALSVVYNMPLLEMLALLGLDVHKRQDYSECIQSDRTRPVDLLGAPETLEVPLRFDPSFSARSTALLNRVIQEWGRIPFEIIHKKMEFSRFFFVQIGEADNLMYPLLRAGSIVKAERLRRAVSNTGWQTEYDRPLYVVQTVEGYRCCWCLVDGKDLVLVPHPLSKKCQERYRMVREVQILGQVIGVYTPLVATEDGPTPPAQPRS
ncbi:MAG: helix-turn-helix transcriptional regulator [Acidobacteria bacterium]|nr:helix-turn-helix transcriptional regulator [Acidobacteriota bacterium]